MKAIIISAILLTTGLCIQAAPSILDITHSITDDNIIAPESFETKTRELEENFYIRNFVAHDSKTDAPTLGTPADYEQRLKALPTVIELPYNPIVGKFIDMYLSRRASLVADMLALHGYYGNIFVEELLKQGMPTELQYLPVIESAINPNAVSRAGAAGLWQFMPATATGLGMEVNSVVDERRDPRMSSRNAATYLKQLYEIYGDWSLAIAAYNCGPGNVNKAIRRAGGADNQKKDFWQIYNYLPSETRGYVPAFIAANYVMNYHQLHGIRPTVVKRHLVTDTIHVSNYVHFNQISSILNIPVDEIRMLNPQYLTDVIPGDYRPYVLTLPSQQCLSYLMSEPAILAYDADRYSRRSYVEPGDNPSTPAIVSDGGAANLALAQQQTSNAENNLSVDQPIDPQRKVTKTHTVARGENIRDIARTYGVSATDIKRWNNLRRGKVNEGDVLIIEVIEQASPDDVALVTRTDTPEVVSTSAAPRKEVSKSETTPQPQQQKPATTKPAAKPQPAQTKHKVKSGDTLDKLARRYGVTVAAIQKANGLKNTRINIGQTLTIPAPATRATPAKKKRR